MPYAAVNGLRLHYEIDGGGPTVLLLHPVGLDLTCWDSQVGALVPAFRVLRVDLRGHGRSDVPPPPYSLRDFAADVHTLLQQLQLAPAHVIGLSLGGMAAQILAMEYSNDVRSLVLADTTSTLAPEARRTMIERGEAAKLVAFGIPEHEAKQYEGKICKGDVLISIQAEGGKEGDKAKEIFKREGATDIAHTAGKSVDAAAA